MKNKTFALLMAILLLIILPGCGRNKKPQQQAPAGNTSDNFVSTPGEAAADNYFPQAEDEYNNDIFGDDADRNNDDNAVEIVSDSPDEVVEDNLEEYVPGSDPQNEPENSFSPDPAGQSEDTGIGSVIISDNPVVTDTEQLLDDLDKEINELLKALTEMDSISEEELNF